jgi:glycosyltransferase involved in cell wall biosynthesis
VNILFLTHQGDMAGSTNSIYYLADGLARRGHSVFVGCRAQSALYTMLQDSPAQAVAMTFGGPLDLSNIRQIKDTVARHDIRIINAQSSKDRYTSIWAKLFYRLPVKLFHTRRQTPRSSGNRLQNWFYTRFTDGIIAVSKGVKDSLVQLGLPDGHIHVIRNGTPRSKYDQVSPQQAQKIRYDYRIKDDETVIGCISRYKQQEQLLEALCHIPGPLTVLFVGIDERDSYRQIREDCAGHHRIIYTGRIAAQDILHYYLLLQVKILPSITEGLSQALLEAMALGVPVIATRAAGNIDLIQEGVNGLFFEAGDSRQLAERIQTLLDDEALHRQLSEKGRLTALEDFSLAKTLDNYEAFFAESLGDAT